MASSGSTILDMPTKRNKSSGGGGKRGRPATGRAPTETVFARVKPELAAALNAYIKSLRPEPKITAVVVAALEDFLASKGFWPPPDQE